MLLLLLLLQERPPYICGHGGDPTQRPPNTAAAYKAALEAGADCMEIDAALTADLVLVALHNRDLQKLLGQSDAQVCLLPVGGSAVRHTGSSCRKVDGPL